MFEVTSTDITKYLGFIIRDSADLTLKTGLTVGSFTVYSSRNGATARLWTTPTFVEKDATNLPGLYHLLLDEDTTLTAGNDAEEMILRVTYTGMQPAVRSIMLVRNNIGWINGVQLQGDGDATPWGPV